MSSGPVGGDAWSVLFTALKQVRTSWPARGWSWDTRLLCVTSSFNVEIEGKARTAVAAALPTEWTSTTIARAPLALRDLAEKTGGLRAGQMILTGASVGSSFGYGLWWPWGDSITTSVRIGLGGTEAREDTYRRLREVFGVEA
jgi:hypothetical protein